MIGLVWSMLEMTWKVFSFAFVVNVFWIFIKNGKDTLKELATTVAMAIKVVMVKIQKWLFKKYTENKES